KTVTVPAHPSLSHGGHTRHQRVVWNVSADERPGRDESKAADRRTANDRGVCTDRRAALDERRPVFVFAHDLRSWIRDVGEDTGWTAEDIVLERHSRIQRHI